MFIRARPRDGKYLGTSGHDIYFDDVMVGHRPYDGSTSDEAREEALAELGKIMCKSLGWDQSCLDDDDE